MSIQIDLNKYADFVFAIASMPSRDLTSFMDHIDQLDQDTNVNIPLLLTSGIGLGSESGEFQEIVKKVLFQGKPLSEDTVFHLQITWV